MRGSDIRPPPSPHSEVSSYSPSCPPVSFSLHSSSPSSPHTNHTLSRDSTPSLVADGYGAIFSVGGPVWAMDWAPVSTATANQILAVAPYGNRYDVSGCGVIIGQLKIFISVFPNGDCFRDERKYSDLGCWSDLHGNRNSAHSPPFVNSGPRVWRGPSADVVPLWLPRQRERGGGGLAETGSARRCHERRICQSHQVTLPTT